MKGLSMDLRRKGWAAFLLGLCIFIGAAGCGKKADSADTPYKIYYVNQDVTALVEAAYQGEMEDAKKAVPDMLKALRTNKDDIEEQPAIPEGVAIEDYSIGDEKLELYFNSAYQEMDVVRETLCRAALVRSLTQIDGVILVAFYVDGQPLTNKDGREYGYMQAEDFVANTGSSINSYEVTNLSLYFAKESGDKLAVEAVSVRFNTSQPTEKGIVEQLMKGPSKAENHATIPKGTKLLGVSIRDGVCYLNFDEGLKNITPGVMPETVIYSIVNSMTESGSVSKVQIAINGESDLTYLESVELGEPLSRNLDIVEEN